MVFKLMISLGFTTTGQMTLLQLGTHQENWLTV